MSDVKFTPKARQGFTFIEVLLAVGVMAVIGGMAAPTYRNYQIRSDLYLARDVVLQALYRARLLSQAGELDDAWSYNIEEGFVFKGTDFDTRNSDYDELFAIPNSVSAIGIPEVNFERINGAPSPDGDIVLQALNGDKLWIPISPDTAIIGDDAPPVQFKVRFDRIEDDDGTVTFCHKPGTPSEETKTLPEQAWFGHQTHGDELGICPADGEEITEILNVVYVGADATPYYEGQWIPLTENGAAIVDGAPTFSELGLYVQRQADHMIVTHYGGTDADITRIIDAVIFIDTDTISGVTNGSSPNESENPFNGSVSDSGSNDEVTVANDDASALFQARESNGSDSVLINWGGI